MITIVSAEQTCNACPSQWDAVDYAGNVYYLRYRFGYGAIYRYTSFPDNEIDWTVLADFEHGDSFDGEITLEEFCQLAGIKLVST